MSVGKQEIVRVYKLELTSGTYYVPQRRVYKPRWFSESDYVWEDFHLTVYGAFEHILWSYNLNRDSSSRSAFLDPRVAEHHCSEYIRVRHGSEQIKVWGVED